MGWSVSEKELPGGEAEHEDGPVDLDALAREPHLQVNFVITHYRSELRLVIVHVVLAFFQRDSGVVSADGGGVHPDFALVASPHANALFGDVLDADEGGTVQVDLLENEVLSLRQVDGHQFKGFAAFINEFGILLLADLAEEFVEVVIGQSLYLALLHFRLVPTLQTGEVHRCAAARTFTGTAQELPIRFPLFHHAVFALPLRPALVHH